MKVLSMLAAVVALTQAGDVNNVKLVAHGGSSGNYLGSSGSGSASYSAPVAPGSSLGKNFVDDVFGGSGGSGRYQGGGFRPDDIFAGKQNRIGFGSSPFGSSSYNNQGSQPVYGFGAGGGSGGLERGTIQASVYDELANRLDRRDETHVRDGRSQGQSAARKDNQERQGDYQEGEKDQQQLKEARTGRGQQEHYKKQAGHWNQDSRRQNDQDRRKASNHNSQGETIRSDKVASDGAKALGVRKTAFIGGNLGFENIHYNFDKDSDQIANEKGGYKEETGRDNNNVRVYREKQRDHRFSNSDNESFRKANDLSRNAASRDWLQNALQRQGQNYQNGHSDRLKDAAGRKTEDFNTFFDQRDDRIWNTDRSRDAAYRGAEDLASKNGLHNKDAIAKAAGKKGVADNKYYGGSEFGDGGGHYGYNTAGGSNAAPVGSKKVNYDDKYALQRAPTPIVAEHGAPGRGAIQGRLEKSGGDVINAYRENAIQGDLANQVSNKAAQSKANAANEYLRKKGLLDSVNLNKAKEGKWANQREGFRDGRQQGYNSDRAEATRGGEAVDNAYLDSTSLSNLDSGKKGLDLAKLDRINLKSDQVDSNQNIRSKKQFYHDKKQAGFNNEALNYNRNRGDNDFGAQETAQKEAKTRASNLHQDSKSSIGQRKFDDYEGRRTSDGDAIFKKHSADQGNENSFSRERDEAQGQAEGYHKNKLRQEFDNFQQNNNQQNKKLWDKANKDFSFRNTANNLGRRTDGVFKYDNTGFRSNPSGSRSSGSPYNSLGTSRFGRTGLGLDGGYYTSQNSGTPGAGGYGGGGGGGSGYGGGGGGGSYNNNNNRNNNYYGFGKGASNAGQTTFGGYW